MNTNCNKCIHDMYLLIQLGVVSVQDPRLVQFLVTGPSKRYPLLHVKLTILPTILSNSVTMPLGKFLIFGHRISILKKLIVYLCT